MSRGASTRRHVFFPYRYEPAALSLRVERVTLDGRLVSDRVFDAERGLLDLSGHRCTRVSLAITVEATPGLVADVFDERERSDPPGAMLVQLHCAATRVRRAVAIPGGLLPHRRFETEIALDHGDVAGSVLMTPFLVRTGSAAGVAREFASVPGSRLASGRSAEVRFELLRTPPGEFLDIRYESFKARGAPQFPHVDVLYKLECGESPILWINSDHARVCAVLDDRANIGRMARVRDLLFDHLGQAIWTRLFLHAAADYARTGESLYPWQEAVLASILPLVYPSISDHDSRVEALTAELASGDQGELLASLEGGLQQWLEVADHANKLAEELT